MAPEEEYSFDEFETDSDELVLYVEAVRHSAAVNDQTVAVEITVPESLRSSFSASASVSFTAVKLDILGRQTGESTYQSVPVLLASNPYDANNPPPVQTIPGNHRVFIHKIRVYDPRKLEGDWLQLGDVSLPLNDSGSWKETPAFWVDAPPYYDSPGGVPEPLDALRVPIESAEADWEYNPSGKARRVKIPPATETEALFAQALTDVVNELEADTNNTWRNAYAANDDGAFGKEVHKRIFLRLESEPRWVASVWIDPNTKQILSIGVEPPGGTAGRVEMDVIRLKPGAAIEVGQIYDHSLVEQAFEVKTSANGAIDADKRTRMLALTNNQPFRLCTPPKRHTPALGWHDHPTGGRMWKVVGAIGMASIAYAVLVPSDMQSLASDVVLKYQALEQKFNEPFEGPARANEFGEALGAFLTARTGQNLTGEASYIVAIIHLRLQSQRMILRMLGLWR